MPILKLSQAGLLLEGPPRAPRAESTPSIIALTLRDEVIEEMIQCAWKKQTLELSLGNDPKISYGSKAQYFTPVSDPFTHELYRSAVSPNPVATNPEPQLSDDMNSQLPPKKRANYLGMFNAQRLQPGKIRTEKVSANGATNKIKPTAKAESHGGDAALTALQASLASADAKKTANTTKIVKDLSIHAGNKRGSALKSTNKSRFLGQNKLGSGTTRSMPTSPALGSIEPPTVAPTSVPLSEQQAEKTRAIRTPIVHQLALGPAGEDDLLSYKKSEWSDTEFKTNIEKVADLEGGKWKLRQKSFKDLDVWKYPYTSQADRQTAIDAAVRAYDKMRLDLSAPEWERLLQKEERGTGKCLSKLQAKIASGTAKPPRINVNRAEDSGRESAAEDQGNLSGDKDAVSLLKNGSAGRSSSQPPNTKSKKTSEKEAQAKRLLAKPGKVPKPSMPKVTEKKSPEKKDAAKFKSSEYVRDSDEEDDSMLSTRGQDPAKMESPAKTAAKRLREEKERSNSGIPAAKRPKKDDVTPNLTASKHRVSDASHSSRSTNASFTTTSSTKSKTTASTSPNKSSPLANSPTNAMDSEEPYDSSSVSPYETSIRSEKQPKRKAPNEDNTQNHKRHQKTFSTDSITSTSSGGDNRAPWTPSVKILDKARRFRSFYEAYHHLYMELSGKDKNLWSKARLAELHDMHKRLAKLKKEILYAVDTNQDL